MQRHCVSLAILFWLALSTACSSEEGALPPLAPLNSSDLDSSSCEDTKEWLVIDRSGSRDRPKLSIDSVPGDFPEGKGALQMDYSRQPGKIFAIARPVLLTNFTNIQVQLWSKQSTVVVMTIEDRDGATFNYPVKLQAGQWSKISLSPADFRLNDDSKVKKDSLDPARLSANLALIDFGPLSGASGANILRIDDFAIAYQPLSQLNLPAEITGSVSIADSGKLTHPIVIKKGGNLKISAPRLAVHANILVDGGTLELVNASVTFHGRFTHDLTMAARNQGSISISDCFCSSRLINSLSANNGSRLLVQRTEFGGGNSFTTTVSDHSQINLEKVKNIGEVIVDRASSLELKDSENMLVWTGFAGSDNVSFSFPDSDFIASWSLPFKSPIRVSVANSKNILWGLLCGSGCNVTVTNSNLVAVGLAFSDAKPTKVWGIGSSKEASDNAGALGDRTLRLPGSKVGTWNMYGTASADLEIKDCQLGEYMGFQNSKVLISNSTIDGSGGYVSASGDATISLLGSTVGCAVTSTGNSKILLQKCHVLGPVVATGQSLVVLEHSPVTIAVRKLDQATIRQADQNNQEANAGK